MEKKTSVDKREEETREFIGTFNGDIFGIQSFLLEFKEV